MTKFDVYVDGLAAKRQARNDEKYNARLAWSLERRTHGEVLADLQRKLAAFGARKIVAQERKEIVLF